MFCQKCGGKLTGSENVCPFCGNIINNNPQNNNVGPQITPADSNPNQVDNNMNNNVNNMNNNMDNMNNNQVNNSMGGMNNNQVNNNMGGMNNNQVNNSIGNMNNNMNQNAPKKSNLTIILAIVLACVVVIAGVVVFAVVLLHKTEPTTPGSDPTPTNPDPNPVVVTENDTVSFNGFKFEVPSGFKTEEVGSDLLVYSSTFAFRFTTDFTNSYSKYVEEVKKQYPEQSANVETNISGRNFVVAVGEKNGTKMALFVTKATETASFIGYALREDNAELTPTDFLPIAKMLNSVKTSSSFAPSDGDDYGKNGLKLPEFDKDDFKFDK